MRNHLLLAAASLFSIFSVAHADSDDTDMQNTQNMKPQMAGGCDLYDPTCRGVMVSLFGEALFLQPNASNIYYAAEALPFDPDISVPAVSPNWQIKEISPSYQPAFNVGMKLLFTDINGSLVANWERLYTSDGENYTVPPGVPGTSGNMIGPLFDIGPNSAAYIKAHGQAFFHFDAANLLFGQRFCAFKNFYPNVYAGATFARIKEKLSATFSNEGGDRSRNVSNYSTFTGAGPKLGFDFDYRIVEGFFFTGSSSVGLVIGESQNGTTYKSWSTFLVASDVPEPNTQTTSVPNRTQLVPSFEERMGFSYAGMFDCCKLTFGFGYQAQIYVNAIQSIDMTSQVLPNLLPGNAVDSGVFAVGFTRTLSNFIVTGPYLSLEVVF